jgi:hypothetical protein
LNRGIVSRLLGRDGGDAAFDALWVHGYATVNAMHGMLAAKALGIPVAAAGGVVAARPRAQRGQARAEEAFFLPA